MAASPEPRFARIGAMIGDPTRARMLAALLAGQHMTQGEVARAAGVTPQTASGHLKQLIDSELIAVRAQGRHRYFRLADADVAHALEALALVAERGHETGKWSRGSYRPLRLARSCYGHLAGQLGVVLHDALVARKLLETDQGEYLLTEAGHCWLRTIGVADSMLARPARRLAYPCLDWSERRDHLAGGLAVALLDYFIARNWLSRQAGSRALIPTACGRENLSRLLPGQSLELRVD